ncbi:MAG: DUF927 domain-containing protein [Clostridiales bacterium]|nr:DUF927 domain-containing protein [Candidatus Cacconaster stercorequi]
MGNFLDTLEELFPSKNDFDTVLPYQFLYQQKQEQSVFSYNLMVRQMAEYALKVGFRGFSGMYKSFCRAMQNENREIYDAYGNATSFTKQPIELDAGNWEATDDGIKRSNGYADDIACRHPIMPIERLVNIDTGEEKLKLAFRKGTIWRTIVVDKKILASTNKVTELAGIGIAVTSQNAKSFVEYISDLENLNYDRIPESKSIGRLGYIYGEGFSPYVDDLTFDGDAAFKAMFETVKQCGGRDKWLEMAREVRGMSLTAKIVLAASFASPLLEPLNCLPFFVHLWGVDSGTGKTVALMVAASVWGNPAIGSFVKTFDGTVVGMEKTAAFLNNLPLCLDELQLAKDVRGNTQFDVYKLAQGVGRTRGNRGGGIDYTPTWRNCILTTGESPLTGQSAGAGAVNRVIDIECRSSQAVIKDGMRISGVAKRNYGFAGKEFVSKLYESEENVEHINERYQQLFRELSERDTTEKQAMAAAAIVLADELACDWIFGGEEKPMTVSDISEFLASKAAVSAGDRGYKYLCDWVSQNSPRLCGKSDTVDVLGVIDCDRAYIIRNVFLKVLQDAGYSSAALISYLKQNRLIETRGRNNTKARRINGIPTECFCLVLPHGDPETEDDLPL